MSSNKSLLVVEDDPDIRATLSEMLTGEGYAVKTCANGLEALERLRSLDPPDLIVLDLMMPVMDGWQFRVHQKNDPRLAQIPVLALSADATPKAAAIDADAYLRKPVDYDTLLQTIERTLLDLDRRRLHALASETERLASLGTLAAGIAHEINNPLAFVIANLAFVADTLADGEAKVALADARDGCDRIRAIVRDLQLFSRGSDDGPRPVDARAILDSSANIVANEVRQRARLVKDYADVPPVLANDTRLGQVLVNLIVNAAQAIEPGNATKNEVRLSTRLGPDGDVILEVKDTGKGIPREIAGRIFDPFFTTKPVGVGTGLGLSIAHRLVSAMRGELSVESEPGKGATFRVRLPAAHPAPSEAKIAPPSVRPAGPKATKERAKILVIDDEEMIGSMLARVLGHVHDVTSTTDARGAIERVRAGERFDLILCDLMMPEKSGMDVHAEIDAIDRSQGSRMIFLTGGAFSGKAKQFVADGAHVVVDKPFAVDDLLAKIDRALDRAKRATYGGAAKK